MITRIISENDAGQRLDKYLTKALKGIPKSLMYKYIRKKRIKVNGKKAQENLILGAGDIIELYIPDEFSTSKTDADSVSAEYERISSKPDIIFEDDNIIICEKRPGVLAHTGDKGENGSAAIAERETLIFQIRAYLYNKGEYDPKKEETFAPALCNRIDRNTGGIIIAAKCAEALREVNRLIREGMADKRYLCAVHGKMQKKSDTLRGHLFKNSKTKTVTVYGEPRRGTKEIVTHYTVIAYSAEKDISLLEVRLETGRTHQIRAHLSSIGHPLLGEGKYAENKVDRTMGYKYQALYSYRLSFRIPDGPLSYLNGKVFSADLRNIKFLNLFEGVINKNGTIYFKK